MPRRRLGKANVKNKAYVVQEIIPPTGQALREALALSDAILKNIELSEIPLANIALKASRLGRLMNDAEYQRIMQYEASGYPKSTAGADSSIYSLAALAGREFEKKDEKTGEITKLIYITSIEALEQESNAFESALLAARDADVSIASANPHQFVTANTGNVMERTLIRQSVATAQMRLSSRRSFIYASVMQRHHELRFSGIAGDIFSRIREKVDSSIGRNVPDAVRKLAAAYENLQSENMEDWSNAVHSCRRILQDLADVIYPATVDVVKSVNGDERVIKLGPDAYVNRIVAFLEDKSSSERFNEIVGSNLRKV